MGLMENICVADVEGKSGKRAGRGPGLETKFLKSKNQVTRWHLKGPLRADRAGDVQGRHSQGIKFKDLGARRPGVES